MSSNKGLKNQVSRQSNKSQESPMESRLHQANLNTCQERLELFQFAIYNAGVPIFWTDDNARIIYVNIATSNLLGYSREELLEMTIYDIDIEFLKKEWAQRFNLLKQNKVMTIESRYRCKNGNALPVEITGNYLEFKGKEYNCVTFRDLSERKRLEEELHKSKQRYRTIYRQATDGIVLIDMKTGFIADCNAVFERLAGRTIEELRRMRIWELRPPDQVVKAKHKFYDIKEKGSGESRELDFQKPDGEIVHIGFKSSKIEIENNEYLQSIARDITKQKMLEVALKESEKRFRTLFENANDAIVLWEYQSEEKPFKIIEANAAACDLLEYSYEEFIVMTSERVHSQESLSKASTILPELLEKGHATYEMIHLSKSGREIPTEVSSHCFILNDKKVVLSIIRDVTKRKETEKKLKELYRCEERLRRSLEQEMQNRVQFTRALVHELKTPLTPIMGMSSMLGKRLKDPQNIKMASSIRTAAGKLDKRISELLDLAKGELGLLSLHFQWLDISKELNDIFVSIKAKAEESDHIIVNAIPTSLPRVRVDEERFRQVVFNLLNNSLKYTKSGSEITLGASADSEQFTVFVKDNGPGIPKKQQKRVFEAYQQLEADRGRLDGLGLGLSLSKVIVELHGGKIWIESEKGKGSTFLLSIPLVNKTERNDKQSNKK